MDEIDDWKEREERRLAIELAFYAAHKNEWLQTHEGEWVVAQDQNLLGFFPSFEAAFREGVTKFGVQRAFLVKQVLRREPVYFVYYAAPTADTSTCEVFRARRSDS